jgi:hypothetical protein
VQHHALAARYVHPAQLQKMSIAIVSFLCRILIHYTTRLSQIFEISETTIIAGSQGRVPSIDLPDLGSSSI